METPRLYNGLVTEAWVFFLELATTEKSNLDHLDFIQHHKNLGTRI